MTRRIAPLLLAALLVSSPNLQAAPQAPSSFDGYRALLVTAGLAGGWIVAGLVTDGLLLPLLVDTRFGVGSASFRTAMQALGAVMGGLSVDSRYTGR